MARTTVETFLIADDPSAPPERMARQPVRSVPHRYGSDAAKQAAREALEAKGYQVRSLNFSQGGILAYVVAAKDDKKFSSRRRPRVSHRRGGSNA